MVKILRENVNFGIAESETLVLMLFLSRQIVKNLNIMQMEFSVVSLYPSSRNLFINAKRSHRRLLKKQ